jgi:hypothetical protein
VYNDNGDHSTYHSLQTQLTRRFSRGFSGQFTYTWSKALSNGATTPGRLRSCPDVWKCVKPPTEQSCGLLRSSPDCEFATAIGLSLGG